MAKFFLAGKDWSPREGIGVVNMDACQPCPYFRGASFGPGVKDWTVICNWPNNGGIIDPLPESIAPMPEMLNERIQISDIFLSAFLEDE